VRGYIEIHGHESWELDALEPTVLAGLIRDEIMGLREAGAWADAVAVEDEHKAVLAKISNRFDDVKQFLEDSE
jgi:hypothetical protein